jgi:thiol-disulfide isomerase/thioredoxin
MTVCPPRPRRLGRLAAATVLAALALTGCSAQASSTPAAPASPRVGPVTATTLDGQTLRIPGQRPTVALFFTAGCGSCAGAARAMATAQQQTTNGARFLAVDIDPSESPALIHRFLAEAGAHDLPVVVDRDAKLTQTFGITALSTVMIISPDGAVTYRDVEPSADQITRALQRGDMP